MSGMGLTATTSKKYAEINGSSVEHQVGAESLEIPLDKFNGMASFMKGTSKKTHIIDDCYEVSCIDELEDSLENQMARRRYYQGVRDFFLMENDFNIMESYMELVIQYGYVIMFGQIFPLAALLSMISNHV